MAIVTRPFESFDEAEERGVSTGPRCGRCHYPADGKFPYICPMCGGWVLDGCGVCDVWAEQRERFLHCRRELKRPSQDSRSETG